MQDKKILFVSHDASRTGAPIVLLNLLRWIKANTTIEFQVLLKNGGELEGDFRLIAPTYLFYKESRPKSFLLNAIQRIVNKIYRNDNRKKILKALSNQKFSLIYLNTVASNDLAIELKEFIKCPIINHVHENEYSIKSFYPSSLSASIKASIDHFIVVSESGRHNLISNYSINPRDISLFHEFVPISNIQNRTLSTTFVKQELNLGNEFIVGGSGLTSWRKGADIFVNLALQTKKIKPKHNIKFIWVGLVEVAFRAGFEYEKKLLGLKDEVQFIGPKSDPGNYFQVFDVFTLTSREDPFPLVCLEAAALAKPILCFDNAGGMPEFVRAGAGIVVSYGNIEEMALKIIELSEKPEAVAAIGNTAKQMVSQFDIEVIAPQIYNFLINFVKRHG